ncbi:mannosyltransferase [Acrocarpospora phusangensis]|uniref:Mannosyltransferase n=1 Tax=Acrocarpospora phusangensis TaxID=1070424 RepID=A0A919UR76_9ACTN|nr:glycosyltransferase family 39 protein [Acrocarpospora phusangensis]GIH27722.1 mannosyltransferase [Acrocarpospora phusangensis]
MTRVPVFVVVFVMAVAMGVWGLDRGSMWQDEATTFAIASRSLGDLFATLGNVDAVHGLYYLIVHFALKLPGDPEVLIRLPSVLATGFAAVAVAAAARRMGGSGLAAGAAYTLLPVVSHYAQDGRSPALVCAAVALAVYALVRESWVWYAVAVTVAAYLNLTALLVLAAFAVPGVLIDWRRWALASGAAVLATVPLILVAYPQSGQVARLTPPTWEDAGNLVSGFAGVPALLAILALLRAGPLRVVALPLMVVPPAFLLLLSQVKPYYEERYVLYAVVGLALLIGSAVDGVARLAHPAVAVPVAAAVLAVVLLPVWPRQAETRQIASRRDDPAAAARLIGSMARPGDTVLFLPSVRRLVAEAYPADFRHLNDAALAESGTESGTLAGRELPSHEIRLGDRVWTVSRSYPKPEDLDAPADQAKQLILRYHYQKGPVYRVLGYAVRLYVRRAKPGPPARESRKVAGLVAATE